MRGRRILAPAVSADSARFGRNLIRRIALLVKKGLGGLRGRAAIDGQNPAKIEDVVLARPASSLEGFKASKAARFVFAGTPNRRPLIAALRRCGLDLRAASETPPARRLF